MATNVWPSNDNAPLGSANANLLDNAIRKHRKDMRETVMQGGGKYTGFTAPVTANEPERGKHCIGIEESSPAASDAGHQTLSWDFAGTTSRIRTFGSAHSTTPNQTDFPGAVKAGDGTKKFIGIADAAMVRVSISDAVPVIGYIRRIVYKVPNGSPNRTLKRVNIVAGIRPTADSLTVDIRKLVSTADSTNRYTDGSSGSLGTVSLTNASSDWAVEDATFDETIVSDDEIVLKWDAANGAQDVTVLLQFE